MTNHAEMMEYAYNALIKLNHKRFPNEGEDTTLLVMALIAESAALYGIKFIMLRF